MRQHEEARMSANKMLSVALVLGAFSLVVSCSDPSSSARTSDTTSGAGGGSSTGTGSNGGGGVRPGTGGNSGGGAQPNSDAAGDTAAPRDDGAAIADSGPDGPDASAFPNVFFDDFSYANSSDTTLSQFGWTLKSGSGTPGPVNAVWSPGNVSFIADSAGDGGVADGASANPNNRVMRLTASTQGETTISQAEVCHQFVLLEGTYAARVRFADTALSGASTDQIVETFFMISAPSTRDKGNAAYSECDLEYLPNGGWGSPSGLWAVTWESYDYTDGQDVRNNQSILTSGSRQGWHTLNIVVMNGNVAYTVDGASFVTHGGVYYPDSPMAICFNLWFAGVAEAGTQTWVQDVDWVIHVKGEALTAADSERKVAALRESQFTHLNTIR
jgi:hypothetical protein